MTLLDFERSNIAGAVAARRQLRQLIAHIQANAQGASERVRGPLRHEIAERWIETETLFQFSFRIISMQTSGLVPNYEASTAKLFASELNQRLALTATRVFGLHANHWADAAPASTFTRNYIAMVPATIPRAAPARSNATSSPPAASACRGGSSERECPSRRGADAAGRGHLLMIWCPSESASFSSLQGLLNQPLPAPMFVVPAAAGLSFPSRTQRERGKVSEQAENDSDGVCATGHARGITQFPRNAGRWMSSARAPYRSNGRTSTTV